MRLNQEKLSKFNLTLALKCIIFIITTALLQSCGSTSHVKQNNGMERLMQHKINKNFPKMNI
jgi:uncharacterized protein YacL